MAAARRFGYPGGRDAGEDVRPSGMGFDYFYGFMGGESDQWTPWLFRNHSQIFPWNENPNYNMITGMADDAINYLREVDAAAPDKPFFMYYVPGATHAPHQPTEEWIKKFKGKFDMGWNAMRDEIFANQKRLGVIPESTQLTPGRDLRCQARRVRRPDEPVRRMISEKLRVHLLVRCRASGWGENR